MESMAVERVEPGPRQESVWDYPRPPRIEPTDRRVEVEFAGELIADTRRAIRVLETTQAPAFYVPAEDVRMDLLHPIEGFQTVCEWKGTASYYEIRVGDRTARRAAWTYPRPARGYEELEGYIAFYPQRVDECRVDGEVVRAMEGIFYGGWVTSEIVGPIKGAPGTENW